MKENAKYCLRLGVKCMPILIAMLWDYRAYPAAPFLFIGVWLITLWIAWKVEDVKFYD